MNNNKKEFLWTIALTVLLSFAGFALLHFGMIGYGSTFFILTPIAIGYILGQRPTFKRSSVLAMAIGLVSFFYLLITAQLEGVFCVITLLPLIVLPIFAGTWIGYLIRGENSDEKKDNTLKASIYPLIIISCAGVIEHYFSEKYDYAEVSSEIFLPYDTHVVFDHIKSVDTLYTEKPLLLQLGLAVPYKCILEEEKIGAKRICYFQEGTIEEVVTDIKPGQLLRMDVIKYGLPGRKWLKFKEAIYTFKPVQQGTVLTRITSYSTELKPRFYWSFWEKEAIESEHEYVLNDLQRRLNESQRR